MATPDVPDDRLYSDDHEWVLVTAADTLPEGPVRVGITRLAADNLGDLVYLDLPEVGAVVTPGEPCGEVESTKTVSELIAPIGGTITDVNTDAVADPSLVSTDPYGAGWLFAVQASTAGELLTAAEYAGKNGLTG